MIYFNCLENYLGWLNTYYTPCAVVLKGLFDIPEDHVQVGVCKEVLHLGSLKAKDNSNGWKMEDVCQKASA